MSLSLRDSTRVSMISNNILPMYEYILTCEFLRIGKLKSVNWSFIICPVLSSRSKDVIKPPPISISDPSKPFPATCTFWRIIPSAISVFPSVKVMQSRPGHLPREMEAPGSSKSQNVRSRITSTSSFCDLALSSSKDVGHLKSEVDLGKRYAKTAKAIPTIPIQIVILVGLLHLRYLATIFSVIDKRFLERVQPCFISH